MQDRWPIELAAHSPDWAKMAESDAIRIGNVLGSVLVRVHHIGSTSVPGIKAKPIVDLLPLVTDLAPLDACEEAIRALGYDWWGEYGIAGRRYCRLIDSITGRRIFHVHFFPAGHREVDRHLAFRDYLRAHPAVAAEYERVKERAASLHPHDMLAYNDAKNDWIKMVAVCWPRGRGGLPASRSSSTA